MFAMTPLIPNTSRIRRSFVPGGLFLALLVLIAPTWAAVSSAQQAGGPSAGAASVADPPAANRLVRFKPVEGLSARPGEKLEVSLEFDVLETWHINAHKPNEDFLIATELSIPGTPGITVGPARYPKAKSAVLAFSDSPLAVYEGEAKIDLPLAVARDAKPGVHEIEGSLRFQACNDQVCLPPATIPVRFALTVAGEPVEGEGEGGSAGDSTQELAAPGAPAAPAGPIAGFETGPPPGGSGTAARTVAGQDNLVGRWFAEGGSLLAFVLIFLMGLALNLTPCVYPMMGVTLSLFGGSSAAPGSALPKAIVYVLGIALMYSTLGVVAAMTGGLFGGWLANPSVLAGIGVLLLAMALSMFGLYELQVPSGILSRLGGAAGAGYLGTFLAGLLVGVFAAPCIGPPIIALLAHVGAKADPVFGFWAFFVLSLGLGLPYLILGASSGMLQRLPRSGAWMDWVKHLLGVILLGVAAFYLCLAFAPTRIGWVVPATLLLGGLYLGFLEPTGRDRPGFRRFRWAVGTLAIVAAALLAFRPAPKTVEWAAFSDAALSEANAAGRPVLLDFSAQWCVPCHELDQITLSDARVIEQTGPFLRMKVDLTRFDSPESKELRTRFAIAGVPTIIFLAPGGREIQDARVVGFLKPEPFLEKVRIARAAASLAGR